MTWFAFTIISPILNALVNYIDKYLIEKVVEGRGIGSLIIFSALMGLPVALFILLFGPNVFSIHPKNAFLIMLNGSFYVAWVLPYLYALQKDEASVVAPLFQLSSVMAFALGFVILGEGISTPQILGCLLILLGATGLSLERGLKGFKVKYGVLVLISISCLFIALSGVIFKFIALEESFWVTSFWESLGIFLSSLILLTIKSYRYQFLHVLHKNRSKIIALNVVNETVVIVAKVTLNFATMLAPVAVVYFVAEGFQPFFVLAYGVLLSIFFPKLVNEKLEQSKILQKLLAICVMFAGTYLISFY
ncbi:hypothetical protein COT50_02715 [candidate division WWE3 bacterium CG08_land_8_20_14_0_20_41_10]|uniref:EamA domain-containing protein n=1 Tax=candidate division WWE3 bacterium CG08_land_8_20_14_0_20_41_10 TaxID=1975085 RepID=A0A2H0XBH6_UNCKA|nr:MAG: hypothetical protein COT50_02715 [candidate division WWE3 bacterium CG08_land_8_20_14_0_20_41_10]